MKMKKIGKQKIDQSIIL